MCELNHNHYNLIHVQNVNMNTHTWCAYGVYVCVYDGAQCMHAWCVCGLG